MVLSREEMRRGALFSAKMVNMFVYMFHFGVEQAVNRQILLSTFQARISAHPSPHNFTGLLNTSYIWLVHSSIAQTASVWDH